MGGIRITPQNGRKNECLLSLADYLFSNNLEINALAACLLAFLLYLAFQRGTIRCEDSSSLIGESLHGFFHTQWPSSRRVGSKECLRCQPGPGSVTCSWHIFNFCKCSGKCFEIRWFNSFLPCSKKVKLRQRFGSSNLPQVSVFLRSLHSRRQRAAME